MAGHTYRTPRVYSVSTTRATTPISWCFQIEACKGLSQRAPSATEGCWNVG
ncbi:predicted protein [Plenodomus lingam JN3]|uniref:Predicted protein n=1 Tax=Leptosphaeria maculans (strain JN3 / isolate v23.1.3 / race Av1-4-5-6-7-8) TaxID=985895 RepID=E5A897_LEPMJ|nr:predicted protein [Plenodomus lingam JN3]CBX99842.1 predicted protein [Plenodomus lingam JN3]